MPRLIFFSTMLLMACSSIQKSDKSGAAEDVPSCIQQLIKTFQTEGKQNPPRNIYSYTYNDSTVYYVPPICCDQFSDLYNGKCVLIAHPDGGFTGKGDGRAKDFFQKRTNEKLIWKDER